jgi:hypothetical protein
MHSGESLAGLDLGAARDTGLLEAEVSNNDYAGLESLTLPTTALPDSLPPGAITFTAQSYPTPVRTLQEINLYWEVWMVVAKKTSRGIVSINFSEMAKEYNERVCGSFILRQTTVQQPFRNLSGCFRRRHFLGSFRSCNFLGPEPIKIFWFHLFEAKHNDSQTQHVVSRLSMQVYVAVITSHRTMMIQSPPAPV